MKMALRFPTYPDLTTPNGELPDDKRAQACWYFYTLAQNLWEKLGKSTEDQFGLLDGELWMDPHYVQLARSIANLYSLESPDEFAKFWPYVDRQCVVLGFPKPKSEYMNPLRVIIH